MNILHATTERRIIRQMNFQLASEIDQNVKQVRLEEKHVHVIKEMCLSLAEFLHKLNRQVSIFCTVSKPISNYYLTCII